MKKVVSLLLLFVLLCNIITVNADAKTKYQPYKVIQQYQTNTDDTIVKTIRADDEYLLCFMLLGGTIQEVTYIDYIAHDSRKRAEIARCGFGYDEFHGAFQYICIKANKRQLHRKSLSYEIGFDDGTIKCVTIKRIEAC